MPRRLVNLSPNVCIMYPSTVDPDEEHDDHVRILLNEAVQAGRLAVALEDVPVETAIESLLDTEFAEHNGRQLEATTAIAPALADGVVEIVPGWSSCSGAWKNLLRRLSSSASTVRVSRCAGRACRRESYLSSSRRWHIGSRSQNMSKSCGGSLETRIRSKRFRCALRYRLWLSSSGPSGGNPLAQLDRVVKRRLSHKSSRRPVALAEISEISKNLERFDIRLRLNWAMRSRIGCSFDSKAARFMFRDQVAGKHGQSALGNPL